MDPATKSLMAYIADKHRDMIAKLHHYCEINSGTKNLSGLEKMKALLIEDFSMLADEIEVIPLLPTTDLDLTGALKVENFGQALWIRKRPQETRRVLLCGHMDTVYHQHHPFQQLTYLSDNKLQGPGVTDMKGGLVVLYHALLAFEQSALTKNLGWDVFINTDEEVGSPSSSLFYQNLNHAYEAALIFEPSINTQGDIAKNRKGSGKFTILAKGKAAHAGRDFALGKNAIGLLAKIVEEVNALNDKRPGVTLNIGLIQGGQALNIVPDTAVMKIDVRIENEDDAAWVNHSLNQIVSQPLDEGFQLELKGHFGRPVKKVNQQTTALFKLLQNLANELNLRLTWQDSGGCCDGNNLSQKGYAVIDTLGVRGGHIHSEQEFILLDSLIDRTQLTTLLLHALACK